MTTQRPARDPHGLAKALRGAARIVVVGIGSDLRGDDAAGLLVIRELRAALGRTRPAGLHIFDGGTAPENMTGEILRCRPSHILLVDAADLGLKPGAAKLIAPGKIGGISFSTHVLPLKILADYLTRSHPCAVLVLGLQPGRTDVGRPPSRAIRQAARRAALALRQALRLNISNTAALPGNSH